LSLRSQEFGGNVDKNLERYQYLNSPFIARYVRFHPLEWSRRISMRAGLIGCPYRGYIYTLLLHRPQRRHRW